MTYIVPEIALATRADILGILNLQEQNLLGRGGLLSVRLPGAFIEAALDDLPQIVAHRDGKIVAYLLAGSRTVHAQTPIIKAMFRAYSGSHDAYIYGPISVAESERGQRLATALFAELREAGVLVFAGNDNIRDSWWPYGDADMLERAMLVGYRSGFYTDEELTTAFDMVSSNAAAAMRIPEYGLRRGASANFIALPARHVPEAVVGRPPERSVYRSGKLIARNGKLVPERNSTDRQ